MNLISQINNKLKFKHLPLGLCIITICTAGYVSFRAVYPDDAFYFDEFETITLQKIANSAKIIHKQATFPDMHGDYTSSAVIELSAQDFDQLWQDISHDNRFYQSANDGTQQDIFERKTAEQTDQILQITFFHDTHRIKIDTINW
ncbi:hypothetical protein ACFBZI_04320 [Moraxella sp. ZJ142]|uniref:hypothetical protein n=1 Tax=Moraxella marmotae TaxID=3344520 RepID=UPI0035D416B3